MLTTILLCLALLPAPLRPDPCHPGTGARPAAFATVPTGSGEHPGSIRGEVAAGEGEGEPEEEDLDDRGLNRHPTAPEDDPGLFIARGSRGPTHLRNIRDRRRFSRSPPEAAPLPARRRVVAEIG
jgi:hypothetical protein